MYKKMLIIVLALVMCLSGTVNVFAEENKNPEIEVNGKVIEASARILEGEPFLPLRAVSEELGYDLQWLGNKKGITLSTPERSISINLSELKIAVNQHESYLSGEYRILKGSTYMRKDFFSDVLGMKVVWDKTGNKITMQSIDENDIVISTTKEHSETNNLLINIQYLQLKGLENKEVEGKFNSLFAKLAEEAKDRGYQTAKEIGQDQITRGIKAEVYYDYKVKYNQKGFLSIVLLDYLYSGGAHGLTVQSSYNFDLKTGTEYKLRDLFKNDTDYVSMLSGEVKNQMAERELAGYLIPFEAIRADQDFYLSNDALVIYFQAYEYTPYAAGIPEFGIGFPEIENSVSQEFEFLNAIPMKFEKRNNVQKIKAEDKVKIGTVLDSAEVDAGWAYIYEKADDKENLYGGFAAGEAFYDLGAVGSRQGSTDGLTCVRTLELYGKTIVKFQGVFGSHVTNTSFFEIDRDIPVPFLSTEGIVSEMDIDGDGIKEIIAELPGTIPSVNIAEWDGASFITASADEALGAGSVAFNREDGSFSAWYKEKASEATKVIDYYYTCGGLSPKTAPKDAGDILSENIIDYNKDSIYEKLVVKMTEGKQYEEVDAGPYQGWNWQGKFVLQLIDDNGGVISGLELNEAFGSGDLIFNKVFLVQFDDYNNDGNIDFAIGQYGSSNGNVYRLFTLKNDKIELLPIQTGGLFSSGGTGRYAISLEKFSKSGFLNSYYDNSKGKIIKQYFVWDGSQFVLKTSSEE